MRTLLVVALVGMMSQSGLTQMQPLPAAPTVQVTAPAKYGRGSEQPPPSSTNPIPPSSTLLDPIFCPEETCAIASAPNSPAAAQCWLRGEYLMWWGKGSRLPALITTSVPGATALPGAIGQLGTSVVYGDTDMASGLRSGGRFSGGVYCDPCRTYGFDASYFFLCSLNSRFDASSDSTLGSPLIARPFFDVISGTQNAQLVSFPLLAGGTNILTQTGRGLASGEIHASTYSRLQGADANVFCGLCSGCNYWVQALAGFRYLHLEEGIAISETTRVNPVLPLASPFFGGSTITMSDQFDTRNNFYGGQVGLRGEARHGRMFVEVQSKLAMGVTNQIVDIQGSTSITSPGGATTTTPAGFLATGSNSGHFVRNRFAVVPELGINGGYQVCDYFRVFVGYNFLYWSSVVRPADQIDTGLSGTQIPTDTRFNPTAGPARPDAVLRDTGFWVQGISFGAEFRY